VVPELTRPSRRVLDPLDPVSEVLFGLITRRTKRLGVLASIVAAILPMLSFHRGALSQDKEFADVSAAGLSPPQTSVEEGPTWSLSAFAYAYLVYGDRDFLQPTITADRDWLHLEARYNYEDLDTASGWVGWNLGGGESLTWSFAPMLGVVFGHTTGVAPGYKGSLGYWKLELYSEGEYLVDTADASDSFFYNWSEFTISPVDWFRIGLVTQRTRAYETDRDVQRGLLIGFSYEFVSISACLFNIDEGKPTVALGIGVSF